MAELPKLKVKRDAWKAEFEVEDFERAREFPYGGDIIIAVEGRQVNSYDDLLRLVEQDRFKNRKSLEVLFLPMIAGG
jgi:hypothetical protein